MSFLSVFLFLSSSLLLWHTTSSSSSIYSTPSTSTCSRAQSRKIRKFLNQVTREFPQFSLVMMIRKYFLVFLWIQSSYQMNVNSIRYMTCTLSKSSISQLMKMVIINVESVERYTNILSYLVISVTDFQIRILS